ncbi:MAG: glucosidase [Deltaproteobacteria bacterium]
MPNRPKHSEQTRLDEDAGRERNWSRWGPYLSERQWGTVREDYSSDGACWSYFSHDQARSRAYRWGEDGLLGITDRECRLCFSVALWNGNDPILKERLFGLTGPEGNHGEDVKELYYYLDATPTSSYLKALYKYPQTAFPYAQLVEENRRRGRDAPEYELEDTGVFDGDRYFDVLVEYAKAAPDDILIRITCSNRGPEPARLHLLPTLWLRNTWAWGRTGEAYWPKGRISDAGDRALDIEHASLGKFRLACDEISGVTSRLVFTDNETNAERLFGGTNTSRFTKDAFHRLVIGGDAAAVNPDREGTKAAAWSELMIAPGDNVVARLRLSSAASSGTPFDPAFDAMFALRIAEADEFYAGCRDAPLDDDARRIVRQADASMVWSRQFYHYIVEHWLEGDPAQPSPPTARCTGRNHTWRQLWARDVLAMPDSWEYPWFAAWDMAFHCVAMARVDAEFAKHQILLLCREWYMNPNGQLPAYEFAFGDVNPPLTAWAAWRVYELARGPKDRLFLERAFQKCLVNFTWWLNREDTQGNNLFTGGFLGLDNIGVFDRSHGLPSGARLEQADATAWMAFYCTTMLAISLELARTDDAYTDIATTFFEHFVNIADATNRLGGTGLWDEQDGFYYDQLSSNGMQIPLRIRSVVGVIPLLAAETLDDDHLRRIPRFRARLDWFLANKPELARSVTLLDQDPTAQRRLLAIPTRARLERVLAYVLDEDEFLSPFGIRSLSKVHREHPYVLELEGRRREVRYVPGESTSGMFGGNSNWRGPVWMPINYLLAEALKRYYHFYGDAFTVECPTGSGNRLNLREVGEELERRLVALFQRDVAGRRPCHGNSLRYANDAEFCQLLLFHEYFDGDDGRGLGASHQTGWTALAGNLFELVAATRAASRRNS